MFVLIHFPLFYFPLSLFSSQYYLLLGCCTSEAVKELRVDGAENLNISKHRKMEILGKILAIFSLT